MKGELINKLAEMRQPITELKTSEAEHKEVEEELRKSKQLLERTLNSLRDAIFILEPDTVKIVDCNPAASEIFGYSYEEMVGRTTTFLHVDEVTLQEFRRHLYAAIEEKGFLDRFEFRMKRKDGTIFPTEHNVMPLEDEQGNRTGWVNVVRDITERKRVERRREQIVSELTHSNAELGQFTYVVAHDLQEPLLTVVGSTQLLAKRYKGKSDSDADAFITFAVDGANRMQQLITDLLAYSQIGSQEKNFEPSDCERVLGKALANLKGAIEKSGAMVTHDSLPTVMADTCHLAQLFQNLIGNAIKFHGEDPPRVHVSAEQKRNEWVFSVRDNGIGLDPKYAEHLFVIFQRLHPRTEYPGTGIGLAMCRKIVERHGGQIWVESEPDKGSIFYFTLPRKGSCCSGDD